MKTTISNTIFFAFLICFGLILNSCTEDPDVTDDPDVDFFCDGNGDNSFWPLQEGNEWVYDAGASNITLTVNGTAVFDGNTYAKITVSEGGLLSYKYIRNDASGNTYEYVDYKGEEHRIIAASPAEGQVVSDQPPGGTFNDLIVDHYGAPLFDVYPCDYETILYIQEFDNTTGDYKDVEEYVKGVGPLSFGTGIYTFKISSATLHEP